MKVGIVGLEYAGKKSLFSLLTGVKDENLMRKVGTVNVPDERVDSLAAFYQSKKKVYSQIEFNLVPSIKKSSDETKKTLADAKLKDDSGEIIMSLWGDDAAKYATGDKVKIENGWVSEFKGNLQLSAGKFGKITKE